MPVPFLANLFKGKAGEIIESVGNVADKLFTSKEEKEAFKLDFEKEVNRHFEQLEANALKETEAYLKDTQNAREANVQIQLSDKASWWAKNTGYFLDVFLGLIWGTVTIFILAKAMKFIDSNADMTAVLSIYSTVTATFFVSLNFHRGTSKGSEDKGKQIAKMMNK